jgi:hypothetical protein
VWATYPSYKSELLGHLFASQTNIGMYELGALWVVIFRPGFVNMHALVKKQATFLGGKQMYVWMYVSMHAIQLKNAVQWTFPYVYKQRRFFWDYVRNNSK